MPLYEFKCKDCGHEFEAFQSIKDDPLTECPNCGNDKAKRQISLGGGFILKGGGWYSDLYSSTPKGSSKSRTSGSIMSACAMATRCFIPPESSAG